MIPKTIHYVWVGHNPKSKIIQECIATWKKNLPDFKFVEWNEDTFDMHENKYIEQAYQAKKWAFVSDYIRAQAIYEQGGIYLDTDVRVVSDLTPLLNDRAFIGFENNNYLSAAIFGAERAILLCRTFWTTIRTATLNTTSTIKWPGSTVFL